MQRILITGVSGLVGCALRCVLERRGVDVVGLDVRGRASERGDVTDAARVSRAIDSCDGVVHLAAVSRVVWAERDPDACWATNVDGLRNVLASLEDRPKPPWLLFASSREVYGQANVLPVTDDASLRPVNVYARSKVAGEQLIKDAQGRGLRAAVVRLSNVYGSAQDHADRVIPAFVRAAVRDAVLRVEGADHCFDFTHVDDVARGIVALVDRLGAGARVLKAMHLVSGEPTTLGSLATQVIRLAGSKSDVTHAAPRTFDVARFYGDPTRARDDLGWAPQVSLRDGLINLIDDVRADEAHGGRVEAFQ